MVSLFDLLVRLSVSLSSLVISRPSTFSSFVFGSSKYLCLQVPFIWPLSIWLSSSAINLTAVHLAAVFGCRSPDCHLSATWLPLGCHPSGCFRLPFTSWHLTRHHCSAVSVDSSGLTVIDLVLQIASVFTSCRSLHNQLSKLS